MRSTAHLLVKLKGEAGPREVDLEDYISVPPPRTTQLDTVKRMLQEQHGIDPNSYRHKEYFLPTNYGGCGWGGLANVGCQNPKYAAQNGRCFSFMRT